MNPETILNLTRELNGMPVVRLEGRQPVGVVTDAVVHPTDGVVLGLVVTDVERKEWVLRASDCFVYREQRLVLVTPDAWDEMQEMPPSFPGSARVHENLLGIEVVTQGGKSLGRVVEVYATEGELRTIYRVATSRLRLFVRGGFFVPGDLPLAWLEKGARLIVPADTMERETFSSLEDALKFV